MIKLIKIRDKENHFDQHDVIIDVPNSHICLDDLLPIMEDFLKACGYQFSGELTITEEE